MEQAVKEQIAKNIVKRMYLDYNYFCLFSLNPKLALADIEADEEAKKEIVDMVRKQVEKRGADHWQRLVGCGLCDGVVCNIHY